jgi:hypothetical protein
MERALKSFQDLSPVVVTVVFAEEIAVGFDRSKSEPPNFRFTARQNIAQHHSERHGP